MSESDKKWLPIATLIILISVCVVELLLVVDGGRVTFYAIIAACSILPALYKSQVKRIWAVVATLFVLALLIWDHQAGIRLQRALIHTLRSEGVKKNTVLDEQN